MRRFFRPSGPFSGNASALPGKRAFRLILSSRANHVCRFRAAKSRREFRFVNYFGKGVSGNRHGRSLKKRPLRLCFQSFFTSSDARRTSNDRRAHHFHSSFREAVFWPIRTNFWETPQRSPETGPLGLCFEVAQKTNLPILHFRAGFAHPKKGDPNPRRQGFILQAVPGSAL